MSFVQDKLLLPPTAGAGVVVVVVVVVGMMLHLIDTSSLCVQSVVPHAL